MAPMMRRSMRNLDDEEDINDFDPAYFPRKVYKDGRGPRVRLMLTDAAPPAPRAALYDASHHRPRSAVIDAADPHVREAERAYYERSRWLADAWRGPAAQPPADEPDDDDDDESPRDRYVREISNAYKQTGGYLWATPGPRMMEPQTSPPVPYGPRRRAGFTGPIGSLEADAIQAAYIRTAGGGPGPAVPGGESEMIEAARRRRGGGPTPGVTRGQHDPSAFPSRDAASLKDARAAADQAYGEMCNRLANAWRR